MICPNCGKTIDENGVVCPWCGSDIQVISAVDDLEEELLREMVDETANKEARSQGEGADAPSPKKGKSFQSKKKKKRMMAGVTVIILLIVCVAVVLGVRQSRSHSYEHLMTRAQAEYDNEDYLDALGYLQRIDDQGMETEESLLLEAYVEYALGSYVRAETFFLQVIDMNPLCAKAYQGLLAMYSEQGDMESILALKENVTDSDILAIFYEYLVPEPEFSVESGTFEDFFTVTITAPQKDLTVYYTLDGSMPDNTSELYTEPIDIDRSGETVLTAVCMDGDGDFSEAVVAEYTVDLGVPDQPVATPDSGTFTEKTSITVTAQAGTTIYYTWDGSTPGVWSDKYTGSITVPEGNNVLSLVAIDGNGRSSTVLRCNYTYYPDEDQSADTASSSGKKKSTSKSGKSTNKKTGEVTGEAEVPEVEEVTEEEEADTETEADADAEEETPEEDTEVIEDTEEE